MAKMAISGDAAHLFEPGPYGVIMDIPAYQFKQVEGAGNQ